MARRRDRTSVVGGDPRAGASPSTVADACDSGPAATYDPGVPRFIMLSSLGPDGFARLRENPERLREVNVEVEAMGVEVIEQYALLGPYDFLNVLDAPDEATVAKVVTNLSARGTLKSVTLTAVPIDEYIKNLKEDPPDQREGR